MWNRHHRRQGLSSALAAIIVGVCALSGIRFCRGQEVFSKDTGGSVSRPAVIAGRDKPLTLVCVGGGEGWLFAAAAPVAAKIRREGKDPVLLALDSECVVEQTRLFEQIAALTDSCALLAPNRDESFRPFGQDITINHVPTTADPAKAGLLLAKRFWGRTDVVVAAALEDHQAVVLGAALACRLCVPFVPVGQSEKLADFSDDLNELNVRRIVVAVSDEACDAGFAESVGQESEILDVRGLCRRLVESIGGANVRNIVLFRAPDEDMKGRTSYWLAPYLAFVRESLPVACQSCEGQAAEDNVKDVIRQYSLRPRTVTILGDYKSIDLIRWSEGTEENSCEIAAEPCSRPFADGAAEVGVGRIPYGDLAVASTLVARCRIREHTAVPGGPKVLMIANPKTEYTSLPLCETISRATANEFKNLGIHIDEFYVANCRDPNIQSLMRQSQLIIFEGHITDLTLFKRPPHYYDEEYYDYYEDGEEQWDGFMNGDNPGEYRPYGSTEDNFEGRRGQMSGEKALLPNGQSWPDDETTRPGVFGWPDEQEEPVDPCRLDGIPLLILQSCHSLDDTASLVLKTGATGIVGSVTNVNSASGSGFIKAYCDALLYGDVTLGEALRDARNYLLCVNAVKTARGHSLQSKVRRAAYGFQLWGDPEMSFFGGLRRGAILQPVSVRFVPPDGVRISTPRQRLDTVETERYVLRMFPGSQVGGLVKKLKDRDARRVLPIYFFRMPMPAEFASLSHSLLVKSQEASTRAALLADSFNRFLYVLYFPEKDGEFDEFKLQFGALGQ